MKFRKKPVVVEAHRFTRETAHEVAEWCGGSLFAGPPTRANPHITIRTLEGDMRAELGDWIIKGVTGEFYPCKPDIFEATYEEVDPCAPPFA